MSDHHPSNTLSPERAVRLLRAHAGSLETVVSAYHSLGTFDAEAVCDQLVQTTAAVALIATLLADHIEHVSGLLAEGHLEEIERSVRHAD